MRITLVINDARDETPILDSLNDTLNALVSAGAIKDENDDGWRFLIFSDMGKG